MNVPRGSDYWSGEFNLQDMGRVARNVIHVNLLRLQILSVFGYRLEVVLHKENVYLSCPASSVALASGSLSAGCTQGIMGQLACGHVKGRKCLTFTLCK